VHVMSQGVHAVSWCRRSWRSAIAQAPPQSTRQRSVSHCLAAMPDRQAVYEVCCPPVIIPCVIYAAQPRARAACFLIQVSSRDSNIAWLCSALQTYLTNCSCIWRKEPELTVLDLGEMFACNQWLVTCLWAWAQANRMVTCSFAVELQVMDTVKRVQDILQCAKTVSAPVSPPAFRTSFSSQPSSSGTVKVGSCFPSALYDDNVVKAAVVFGWQGVDVHISFLGCAVTIHA
jgi:hypothetical protein